MHKRVKTTSLKWTGFYYVGDMHINLVSDGRESQEDRDWLQEVNLASSFRVRMGPHG